MSALAIALAAALQLGNAPPAVAPLTDEELAYARADGPTYRSYPVQPLVRWEADLLGKLEAGSPDRAADALASEYGLTGPQMRELVRLWLMVQARQFTLESQPAARAELRRRLLALRGEARTTLVLQAVAESLNRLSECSGEDFAALTAESTDAAADAWAIANLAPCADNFLRAATLAPDRAVPALIRLVHYGDLELREALPHYHWLTRPSALERIAEADRPVLAARLYRRYLRMLFDIGLTERAVALANAMPAALRGHVLARDAGTDTATVDGLEITFESDHSEPSIAVDLAAAYALNGRTGDAEALLATMPNLEIARQAFDCAWRTDPAGSCERRSYEESIEQNVDVLVLDHFLHRPGDDPYPLAEAGFAGMGGNSSSAPVAELRCRVFSEPQFGDICENSRRDWRYRLRNDPAAHADADGRARTRALLAALSLEGLAEARAMFAADLDRLASAAGAEPDVHPAPPSVTPAAAPFAEHPLPDAYRGPRPEPNAPPKRTAPLPEGFQLVRFERNGERAVAISLSQTFDPTGEVSQGAYWMHLSDDGGRRWQPPLYTGLADRFPYVVPRASRMPLLDGDRLNLEVEVAELDTASISYPPVGLRSRRRATGLYLQVPFADLSRDSDGDGLTDIAERNLLLDRPPSAGGTPFVVGSDVGANCEAPDAERAVMIGLLEQLLGGSGAAIVEPLDRPPGLDDLASGWTSAAAATSQPLFVLGEARDFRCLRPNRPVIVYSEADIAELERFRPDFHAVRMPRVVFNRARDRGYVRWSGGWFGGTYRLRLVDGRWVFETISSWIS